MQKQSSTCLCLPRFAYNISPAAAAATVVVACVYIIFDIFMHRYLALTSYGSISFIFRVLSQYTRYFTSGATCIPNTFPSHWRHFQRTSVVVVFPPSSSLKNLLCKNLCKKINKIRNCFEQHTKW